MEDLHDSKILKHFRDDIYTFSFIEDSIPFIRGEDSLFQIKLKGDKSVLFYNSNLYQNTAFIMILGSNNNIQRLLTSSRLSCVNAYYIDEIVILKIEEITHPLILQSSYFILTPLTSGDMPNITLLSKGSYWLPDKTGAFRDSLDILLQDSISKNSIYVEGTLNNNNIKDSINIGENNFIVSQYLQKQQWDNIKIVRNDVINQRIVHPRSP